MAAQNPGFTIGRSDRSCTITRHELQRSLRTGSGSSSRSMSSLQSRFSSMSSQQRPTGQLSFGSVTDQQQGRNSHSPHASERQQDRHADDMQLARSLTRQQLFTATPPCLQLKPPAAFFRGGHVDTTAGQSSGHFPVRLEPLQSSSLLPTVSNGHVASPLASPQLHPAAPQQIPNPIPEFSDLSLLSGEASAADKNQRQQEHELRSRPTKSVRSSVPLLSTNRLPVNTVQSTRPIQQQDSKPEVEVSPTVSATVFPLSVSVSPRSESLSPRQDDSLRGRNPVSVLNEEAAARGIGLEFRELSNFGPSHLRQFTMQVIVGDITAEGSGVGKKAAREEAARKAVERLRLLWPLPVRARRISAETIDASSSNAIGSLQEYLAKQHQPPPHYQLESALGPSHVRTFAMSVTVLGQRFDGEGSSKKEAKFRAARAALTAITGKTEVRRQEGDPLTSRASKPVASKPVLTTKRRVLNLDDDDGQRDCETQDRQVPLLSSVSPCVQPEDAAISAVVQRAYVTGSVRPVRNCQALQHEETLKSLANFLGYQLTCTPFPGRESGMVAVIMTLRCGDAGPLVFHGCEATEELARNAAALGILQSLTAEEEET